MGSGGSWPGVAKSLRSRLFTESRRPAAIRDRPNAFWLAVATVCIGAFMGQLDASIVTVALPTLQKYFHASIGAVTWVGLSYLVTLVAVVTAVGRMADMVGRKLLYVYGFAVFIVGSALCGLAPGLGWLVAFRVLQALGAAMLQANSVAIITLAVPSERLGRAIGVQGAAQALGLALGPSVGGLLLAAGGWRLIFLVNIPAGLLGAVAGWLLIPRSRHLQHRVPFDWWGLGWFVPGMVALLVAVSLGDSAGWTSPILGVSFAACVLLGTAFVVRERRSPAPMLDFALFRRPAFSAGITSGLLSYLVLFGVLFVVPFFFERGLYEHPSRAGIELMVMPVALGLVAPFAGRLADRLGARALTVGGMGLVAAGLVWLGALHGSAAVVVAALAVIGAGLGLFTPPNNAAIMGAAPRADAGVASGVLNMTRGLGTALGLALTGLVFATSGGDSASAHAARHAFGLSAYFLAAVALLAALVAVARGRGALSGDTPAAME